MARQTKKVYVYAKVVCGDQIVQEDWTFFLLKTIPELRSHKD